jgi:hypothetical protein
MTYDDDFDEDEMYGGGKTNKYAVKVNTGKKGGSKKDSASAKREEEKTPIKDKEPTFDDIS